MQAVLVVGDEENQSLGRDRFLGAVLELRDFLAEKSVPSVLLRGRDYTAQAHLIADLVRCMLGTLDGVHEPWLLAYHGHGMKGGWSVSQTHRIDIPYTVLAKLLKKRRGPTLVLNDCCYASSLVAFLERTRVSPHRLGALQASYEEYSMFDWPRGALVGKVLSSWRAGVSFRAPVLFRTYQEEYTSAVLSLDLSPPRLRVLCSVCMSRKQGHLFPVQHLPHFEEVDIQSRKAAGWSETCIRYVSGPTVFKRWGIMLDPCFFAPGQGYFKEILQPTA